MITFLITAITTFITFIINLLPNGESFPTAVSDAFSQAGGYISSISHWLPLDTIYTILPLVFYIEITLIFGLKIIHWLAKKIPFLQWK